MTKLGSHLEHLADAERLRLEEMLLEFDRSWDEGRLGAVAGGLPSDARLRRAALVEMVKIDLERRWQRGQRVGVDYYLNAVPELGPLDAAPPDLLLAEYEVRQQFGDTSGAAALAGRVPS